MIEPAKIPFDRRLGALLDAARQLEYDGQISADTETIELVEELHGRLTIALDELRTARRRQQQDLHRHL